MNHNHG